MTGPALEAYRFYMACLIGAMLGVGYGFLRPFRRRFPRMGDLLFLPLMGYGWLYLCFAVCRGDIRLGYVAGLFVGAFIWELTVGRWLRPVFRGFWWLVGRIFRGIFLPFQKIFKKIDKILKILFAKWKKWFTMVENTRHCKRRKDGGAGNGKQEKIPPCLSSQFPTA